ncbi:MAG TPA: hypothetical protein VGN02_06125 [Paenibacillus sp.]
MYKCRMGAGARLALAKSKGVRHETESEGSRRKCMEQGTLTGFKAD